MGIFRGRRYPQGPPFPLLNLGNCRASIILVAYKNAKPYLEGCFKAIRELDYPNYEVILVDNASEDGSLEEAQRLQEEEIIIPSPVNLGFGGGCNRAAEAATGDVLVFLNIDTQVRPDWLTELLRPMSQESQIAITGCKMYYPDEKTIQHAGALLFPHGFTEHLGYGQKDKGQFDVERDVDYVTGAGMAIRREFFESQGGFDDRFYPAYYEEVDLCYTARQMGYRVVYTPRAVLIHHESPTLGVFSETFLRMMMRARVLFLMKHYGPHRWLREFLPWEIRWRRDPAHKNLLIAENQAWKDGWRYWRGERFSAENPFPR